MALMILTNLYILFNYEGSLMGMIWIPISPLLSQMTKSFPYGTYILSSWILTPEGRLQTSLGDEFGQGGAFVYGVDDVYHVTSGRLQVTVDTVHVTIGNRHVSLRDVHALGCHRLKVE